MYTALNVYFDNADLAKNKYVIGTAVHKVAISSFEWKF